MAQSFCLCTTLPRFFFGHFDHCPKSLLNDQKKNLAN